MTMSMSMFNLAIIIHLREGHELLDFLTYFVLYMGILYAAVRVRDWLLERMNRP